MELLMHDPPALPTSPVKVSIAHIEKVANEGKTSTDRSERKTLHIFPFIVSAPFFALTGLAYSGPATCPKCPCLQSRGVPAHAIAELETKRLSYFAKIMGWRCCANKTGKLPYFSFARAY
jgi:hypothetical protein